MLILLILSFFFLIPQAGASVSSASAQVEVVSALSVLRQRDLEFGEGFTGEGPKILTPRQGAKFLVNGEPGRAFQILLPSHIPMHSEPPSKGRALLMVEEIRSEPAFLGTLDQQGSAELFVGGTRPAITPHHPSGPYSGQFTVTVAYQ